MSNRPRRFKRRKPSVKRNGYLSRFNTEETLKKTVNEFTGKLNMMQQMAKDQESKISLTVAMMLVNKLAAQQHSPPAFCPDGCHHCCESSKGHVYGFGDALITTIQNYPLMLELFKNDMLSRNNETCPLLSSGKCMIHDRKPYMCGSYRPVKTASGSFSCMYRESVLQENADFKGTKSEIPFDEAAGFATQSIFPTGLASQYFSSVAEGTRWVILNLPHLMSEKTLEVLLGVSRNSGDILRGCERMTPVSH